MWTVLFLPFCRAGTTDMRGKVTNHDETTLKENVKVEKIKKKPETTKETIKAKNKKNKPSLTQTIKKKISKVLSSNKEENKK